MNNFITNSATDSCKNEDLSHKSLRSWIEIDLTAFGHNLAALKALIPPDTSIMQIVKADAYGHGAWEIAETALKVGVSALGVANADEGTILRYHGITSPIMILSPALESEIPLIIENNLTPSVSSREFALAFSRQLKDIHPIHLNIDTGMGRSGVELSLAQDLYDYCSELPNLLIEGIYTHFSSAENDPLYTDLQIAAFQNFLDQLPQLPAYIHSANSASLLHNSLPPGNLVRLGALSYGFYTHPSQKSKISLKPVLTFKSRISQLKTAQKDEYIGYNCTFKCKHKTRFAIIPVGYADGYDFLLSNQAKVWINRKLYPVIGKVSMDMIAVDVTSSRVSLNDPVVLLGKEPHLRVEDLSNTYAGSPYELLCQIGRRAPRFFIKNDQIIASTPRLRREFISLDYDEAKLNRVIEAAVHQRLQSSEIAGFVYKDLLKNIFSDQDKNVFFRRKFVHNVSFCEHSDPQKQNYFLSKTTLSYQKTLTSSQFRIACAADYQKLQRYFLAPDVEYRWLLDKDLTLSQANFRLVSARINDIELLSSARIVDNCLEISCWNDQLKNLIGTEVEFSINTLTWYPRNYHQLTIYITGITQGFQISFDFPPSLKIENIIPVLAGKNKFPTIIRQDNSARIASSQWHFPSSGIIFVYNPAD